MTRDDIRVQLEQGYYGILVTQRKGNKNEPVTSFRNHSSVTQIALSLLNYHSTCLINLNLGGRGYQSSAGSESPSSYNPGMNSWKLHLACELSAQDKNLLEGIVTIHNRYQEILNNKQTEISFGFPKK